MQILFHKTVARTSYALDSFYIDDTMFTKLYNMPLECILYIDPEFKSQLLAFSLLKNQAAKFYFKFFTFVKNELKDHRRIIAVNSFDAQISAIKDMFSTSIIVFCMCHIRRHLLHLTFNGKTLGEIESPYLQCISTILPNHQSLANCIYEISISFKNNLKCLFLD